MPLWERGYDVSLTIAADPESLTKQFEIDMMGNRKPLKVTEALVSLSQSTFCLNSSSHRSGRNGGSSHRRGR